MLRGEKWSHCTGIAAFFLPNAIKSSKHVNVGQHKYHFRVQGMRHWSVSVEITERVRFFFFQTDTQLDTSSVSPPNPNMIS